MPSTATLAGALAAIESRLAANWSTSRIVLDGEPKADPWPPQDSNGNLQPWVFVEIEGDGADIIGFGTPTNNSVMDTGTVRFHTMVQTDSGLATARAHAVSIGEIFRQQQFYTSDATAYVRTLTPRISRDASVDEGNFIGMTCSVDYEFYHRA